MIGALQSLSFYNNTLGDSSYQVNEHEIAVSIKNRRQLIVAHDKLIRFFDTSVAIQDDVLLTALEKNDGKNARHHNIHPKRAECSHS